LNYNCDGFCEWSRVKTSEEGQERQNIHNMNYYIQPIAQDD